MTSGLLQENAYNRQVGRSEPQMKLWRSAGLMLTYRCSSRCACCYVFCGPEAKGETMGVEMAVRCWESVVEMGSEGAKGGQVHLTGGEPFLEYDRLVEILAAARERGLGGLEKVETNGSWCVEAGAVRERLERLRGLGVDRLQVSTDVYHQEWVPFERVRLAVEVGREVFGREGVQVRWRDFYGRPIEEDRERPMERAEAFRAALGERPERLVGRAAVELTGYLPLRPAGAYADKKCARSLLGARHVHIDGAGRVFSGTCAGIVVGRVDGSDGRSLLDIWRDFDPREHPVWSVLWAEGPIGLWRRAQALGYEDEGGYASKCHMCYVVRRWLRRTGHFGGWLEPGVCYGEAE